MSSISSFSGNYTNPYANATGNSGGRRVDGDGGGHHHHGGGRIGGAFTEALQQTGLSLPTPPTKGSGDSAGQDGDSSQNTDVSQAYQKFAQTLFQALGDQNQQANASPNAGQGHAQGDHGPGKLAQNLQSLLQQVSSAGTSADGSSAASNLNEAFNNLTQALGNSGSADKPPTLQAFLENFLQDVQTGGNSSTTGLAVNTAV